ncbi:hypothetical protein D9615_004898 [Tricholomella constricta]|uniref:Uncharacterized protein n=1 Tax=Tricholomella constricta TaxID=117010 RepID=A0A8H5M6M3_9AGAR|nr:hypothetical protein D9615_004898 [Tricholomella constricta]
MIFTRLAFVAALVGAAAAEFKILSPGADVWWVAKSLNTLTWTCKDPAALQTFTVLVANKDQKVLTAPIAIIGVQNNFDCSKTITQDQISAPPGTGYTILFANTLNQTDVFAKSEEFEIKPLGSAYPTSTPGINTGGPSPTGTDTSNGNASASGTPPKNSATTSPVGAKLVAGILAAATVAIFAL